MAPLRWHRLLATMIGMLALPAAAQMQQAVSHIGYVYPAGGKQGTTFPIAVGGQALDGVTAVHISGGGVTAAVSEFNRPLNQKQFNDLRERLQELMKGKKDEKVLKEIEDIRKKLLTFNRNINPAIAETVTLQVTIAADAKPGPREIRLATPGGLTNPMMFCVGQLPEYTKKLSRLSDNVRTFQDLKRRNDGGVAFPPTPEVTVKLPTILNGQIMPGGVDRYRFSAAKGKHLVVVASARELIPYLSDAVPGWFQACVTLYDAKGKELTFADHYLFQPDPVLHYEIPADGEYALEIRDDIYRGREDFVYRITMGELPFITGIYPLGGPADKTTPVELSGWNLPASSLNFAAQGPGLYSLSVRKGDLVSRTVPFAVDNLPEVSEQEPNNSPTVAQRVAPPVIINGRIAQPGEWDVFCFEAAAGQKIVAEVMARRLNSPLDSVLKLTDAAGKQIAFNDDFEDKGAGLNTHHADSYLLATIPAEGLYFLHLGDTQRKGGPEYAYRLRISAPRPDFELRVVPASINVRANPTTPITVYALRRDGFTGPIDLSLKDAPAGFVLNGAQVPADQDRVRLTLTVPPAPTKEPLRIRVEGQATIQDKRVAHMAVPAEDMMQAFAYRHLVPADELDVTVTSRPPPRASIKILGPLPVRIPLGGQATVKVALPAKTFFGKLELELSDPPEGISLRTSANFGATELAIQSEAGKTKAGLKGNLIVNLFLEPMAKADKPKAANRRFPVGTLPAIPFEIVGK